MEISIGALKFERQSEIACTALCHYDTNACGDCHVMRCTVEKYKPTKIFFQIIGQFSTTVDTVA